MLQRQGNMPHPDDGWQTAVLNLTVRSMSGVLSVQIPLTEPPHEEGHWVEQPSVSLGDATACVRQDHLGMIRLHLEPPGHAPVYAWATRFPPPRGPKPPTLP